MILQRDVARICFLPWERLIFMAYLIYQCRTMAKQANRLGERIRELRNKKGLSQTGLADKVGISYAQIGRYETKGSQPPAGTLKKIADALGSTPDFLIYGAADEKAKAKLSDADLINQFKAIEEMDEDDRTVIKKLIDAFVTKKHLQKLVR